ncbi:MAG: hydrogenase formation protein HypD, partial [Marinobacterium sp.]
MRFVDEFRDPALASTILERIRQLVESPALRNRETIRVMEVCGGHTHTIFRYGLDQLLPDRLELIHGPGCPVCVLPREYIDTAIAIARKPDVILASFGDLLRVPGT